MAKIQEYRDMGEDAWRSTETCSDFAAAGWEAATGEDLSSWWWTTHSELKYAFLFRAYRSGKLPILSAIPTAGIISRIAETIQDL